MQASNLRVLVMAAAYITPASLYRTNSVTARMFVSQNRVTSIVD